LAAAAFDSEARDARRERLTASGLTLARVGADMPALHDVDLSLAPGESVLLSGPTGAGKSTLLRALAGLGGVERRAGSIVADRAIALLLQHVETQLLCTTVGEEVGIGLRDRCPDPAERARRVAAALRDVDLEGTEAHAVDRLSAGQKQRVVIAALIALEPAILLLDEPLASLDAPSRRRLVDVVARLKRRGTALLVAEHAPRELLEVCDRALRIDAGRLHAVSLPPRSAIADPDAGATGRATPPPEHLSALEAGERVLITGPNGSGKSHRLRALAREHTARGPVALVVQEPRRSLFARTVRDELSFSLDRLRGGARRHRDRRVELLLDRFALRPMASRSPRRSSFGEQHRLAIAAALAAQPAFLLLDEPFAGLDPDARDRLLDALSEEQRESGATIVVASHDRAPLDRWCTRSTELPSRGGPS
jgi:energy-coupling factor transport system ATP-binding protein